MSVWPFAIAVLEAELLVATGLLCSPRAAGYMAAVFAVWSFLCIRRTFRKGF